MYFTCVKVNGKARFPFVKYRTGSSHSGIFVVAASPRHYLLCMLHGKIINVMLSELLTRGPEAILSWQQARRFNTDTDTLTQSTSLSSPHRVNFTLQHYAHRHHNQRVQRVARLRGAFFSKTRLSQQLTGIQTFLPSSLFQLLHNDLLQNP